jgi:hypothetical protein
MTLLRPASIAGFGTRSSVDPAWGHQTRRCPVGSTPAPSLIGYNEGESGKLDEAVAESEAVDEKLDGEARRRRSAVSSRTF